MSDAPLVKCPACGKNTLMKKVTAAAFHLKGTGWYATDIKDKKSLPSDTSSTTDAANMADKQQPAAATEKGEAKVTTPSASASASASAPSIDKM